MFELVAFDVSLAYAWLLIKERSVGWLLWIASGLLYIVIYAQAKLYSDAELQLLYIAIGIYGYFSWSNKKDNDVPVIQTMNGYLKWKRSLDLIPANHNLG